MTQDEERTTITARDLKVVSALQCNGRMTMQALADKIGISVYAATESYKRLTDAGIMTIVPVCNPLSLGNYSQVLVGLRINGNRNEALAMLKAMPQVTYVVCTLGDADIIAEAEQLVGNHVPLADAARLVHPHPTFSETLGEALLKADGRPLHTR